MPDLGPIISQPCFLVLIIIQMLTSLCDSLMDALGCFVPYPLCLALLISAASVPTEPRPLYLRLQEATGGAGSDCGLAKGSEGRRQLCVLITQPPQDPTLVKRLDPSLVIP